MRQRQVCLGGWGQDLGNVGHVRQRHDLAVLLRQLLYQRHLLGLTRSLPVTV